MRILHLKTENVLESLRITYVLIQNFEHEIKSLSSLLISIDSKYIINKTMKNEVEQVEKDSYVRRCNIRDHVEIR